MRLNTPTAAAGAALVLALVWLAQPRAATAASPVTDIGSSPLAPSAVSASGPLYNGKIVFSGYAPGTYDAGVHLYTINPDGTGLKQITFGSVWDYDAEWSPDGSRIVFSRAPVAVDHADIWLVDPDGTDLTQFTTNGTHYFNATPTWSPDGLQIAWVVRQKDSNGLYTVATVLRRAVTSSGPASIVAGTRHYNPIWSPSGARIAYSGDTLAGSGIWASDPDGGNAELLYPDWYEPTDWSPNGLWFLTHSENSVVRLEADGGGVVDLTAGLPAIFDPYNPVYSPDGMRIAVGITADGGSDLATFASNGTGAVTIVTSGTTLDAAIPDWGATVFPFIDTLDSTFRYDILWAFNEGITSGCTPERFCPDDTVTREQMAAFLDRALALPATSTDFFTDDESSMFEASINRLAAAGITTGCSATTYCPKATVKRDQMASFLARAFALPSTATNFFTDDSGNIHEPNINRLAASGITSGCTATTYCPAGLVTRGQMAAFLHRALT